MNQESLPGLALTLVLDLKRRLGRHSSRSSHFNEERSIRCPYIVASWALVDSLPLFKIP